MTKATSPPSGAEAAKFIDEKIRSLGDWRGETLAWVRAQVHAAVPDVVEQWKWMGTPVFHRDGDLCTGESYQAVVKLTFAHGAALPDPAKLFNASLDGGTRRAIDLREGERLDEAAFADLLRAAVAFNEAAVAARQKKKPAKKPA